jgi:serine protease Do
MNSRLRAFTERFKARRMAYSLGIVATLVVGILIGSVVTGGVRGGSPDSSDAQPLQVPAPQQLSNTFAKIAKQIEPAVVNINTESLPRQRARGERRRAPQAPRDEFHDFFDRFFGGPQGPFGDQPERRERSLGSGVIVDSKGYIITNAHVVEGADRVRVKLMGDPEGFPGHEAKVIGSDRETDIAVIKVEPQGKQFSAAKIGNSDSAQVGDWVLAVGSPFGLDSTVTAGIISAVGRNRLPSAQQFQSFIQTDAAINPGNSGGPLVNMSGEIIGINTAIYTQTFGYQGVGFAMPSNVVADVYNQLIGPEHRVTRGSIGILFSAVRNPAVERVYGSGEGGVVVTQVTPGGPSDKAGLKVGDVITAVNGERVKTGDDLVSKVTRIKPGAAAKVTYMRDRKEQTATVTVADRVKLYGDRLGLVEPGAEPDEVAESRFGVTVGAITPQMRDRLGLDREGGVIVQDVQPGSFAEDIGLQRGIVILEVNRQPVNSEADFRRLETAAKSGQDVVFMIFAPGRTGGTTFLGGVLP